LPEDAWQGGIWVLKLYGVKTYTDNGDGTYSPVIIPEFRWVQESATTPDDDEEPAPYEPEPDPEEEPTEEE